MFKPGKALKEPITRLRRQGGTLLRRRAPRAPGQPSPRDSRGLRRRVGDVSRRRGGGRLTTESSAERIAKPHAPAKGSSGTKRPRSARRSRRSSTWAGADGARDTGEALDAVIADAASLWALHRREVLLGCRSWGRTWKRLPERARSLGHATRTLTRSHVTLSPV